MAGRGRRGNRRVSRLSVRLRVGRGTIGWRLRGSRWRPSGTGLGSCGGWGRDPSWWRLNRTARWRRGRARTFSRRPRRSACSAEPVIGVEGGPTRAAGCRTHGLFGTTLGTESIRGRDGRLARWAGGHGSGDAMTARRAEGRAGGEARPTLSAESGAGSCNRRPTRRAEGHTVGQRDAA